METGRIISGQFHGLHVRPRLEADAVWQICAEPLARLNTRNEQFFHVDMNHLEISKFPSRGHPLFAQIMVVLNGMLADCHNLQMPEETTYHDGETEAFDEVPAGQYCAAE